MSVESFLALLPVVERAKVDIARSPSRFRPSNHPIRRDMAIHRLRWDSERQEKWAKCNKSAQRIFRPTPDSRNMLWDRYQPGHARMQCRACAEFGMTTVCYGECRQEFCMGCIQYTEVEQKPTDEDPDPLSVAVYLCANCAV